MLSLRWLIVGLIIIVLVVIGTVVFVSLKPPLPEPVPEPIVSQTPNPERRVIGRSVEGREIAAYTYRPTGEVKIGEPTQLVFVGGIHGGYEWNSVLLAYQFMDYLAAQPEVIPDNLIVTVIPSANPDGVYKVVGKEGRFTATDVASDVPLGTGRFNAHDVDLNRNFACKWKSTGTWRSQTVSAGTAAFSEPEARALRDFALSEKPDAMVFWHSQANAVYASECESGILPETRAIMTTYAQAAGYPAVDSFTAYEVNGDAEGWLASVGIPALSVELKTHETVEWEKNLLGIKALFEYYK